MASFNRVILLGNLTRDIDLRYTPSSMAVCDIGLAVNDRRKGNNGEWIDETTFVDCTLFGRTAEVAAEYLKKGSPVLIEGRLKLDQWETQEGQKRSKLKVVAEKMQLLGGRPGSGTGGGRSGSYDEGSYDDAPSEAPARGSPPAGGRRQPPPGDDIPF